jgi:hypothetical protein
MAGPAYLKGAGEKAGHLVQVIDLNWCWISERIKGLHVSGPIKGDHDKPSEELVRLQTEWSRLCGSCWPTALTEGEMEKRATQLEAEFEEVVKCARAMSEGQFGIWCSGRLAPMPPPDVVGLSVMFSGQVIGALAITMVVRRLWPSAKVVWGGAHVTALSEEISKDRRYSQGIDGFVVGYAERTWVELLDAVALGREWPREVFKAGSQVHRAKEEAATMPTYDLSVYEGSPTTLPIQASRGCAYGKCTFCTYPKIEGRFRKLELEPIRKVAELAAKGNHILSFKDSLLLPNQMLEVADVINGKVLWSACTKLHPNLNAETMGRLYKAGLRTLEIGLETLDDSSQKLIGKQQSHRLFCDFLDAAASAGVTVVVNYMTGLPGADKEEEMKWLEVVRREIAERPGLIGKIEHNTFQLELLSPMASKPADYRIIIQRRWPWSSLADYTVEAPVIKPLRPSDKRMVSPTPTPTPMPDNYGNAGGYPSTTGNTSGGGRSNGPRGK